LNLYVPDEPAYDPDRWLNDAERGQLLHELFENFCRDYKGRQHELRDAAAATHMSELLAEVIGSWRKRVPPPSEMVFERESEELRKSSVAFLEMERNEAGGRNGGEWIAFEIEFGQRAPAGLYTLPDGTTLKLKGKADRVDRLPDATMRVIDYKTGRSGRFEKKPKAGAFNGGRHLQPALYSGVIGAIVSGTVSQFQYRFPTPRGQNQVIGYSAAEFAAVPKLVAELMNIVRGGEFIPTDDDGDCRYCDHKQICRVTQGKFDFASPRAAWAKEHTEHIAAYDAMRARRGRGALA
jgi:ATP-dependent helicase/DNAse subunit B